MKSYPVLLLCIALVAGMTACSPNPNSASTENPYAAQSQDSSSGLDDSSNEQEASLEPLFPEDKKINLLFNDFNKVNPETPIKEGDFSVYNHHGSAHEDQALGFIDGYEIVVSDDAMYSDKATFSISIQRNSAGDNQTETIDNEATQWIHALYPSATQEEVNKAWSDFIESKTPNPTVKVGSSGEIQIDARRGDDPSFISFLTLQKKG